MLLNNKFQPQGHTLYELLIVPPDSTSLLPHDVDLSINLGRGVTLRVPIMSAAMEISESGLAIAMAREGAMGIVHANLSLDDQLWEVKKVIRWEQNFLPNPHVVYPHETVAQVDDLMRHEGIGGFPVVEQTTHQVLGMVTQRDTTRVLREPRTSISQVMTPRDKLITAPFETSVEEGLALLKREGVKKLPLVDDQGVLRGMIVQRDADRGLEYPNACRDERGHLRVGAAVFVDKNPGETVRKAVALVEAGASVIVIDASVGWSAHVREVTSLVRKALPNTCLVSANIVTAGQAEQYIAMGVDALRVGYGPGSTCISRQNLGTGVPQASAVYDVSGKAVQYGISVIADGGVEHYGHAVVALACGAAAVMSGRMFAGCREVAPEMQEERDGERFNKYRGMGSHGAMARRMQGRYNTGVRVRASIEEGVEEYIPVTTSASKVISEVSDALQRAMSLNDAKVVSDLWQRPLIGLTSAGQLETSQRIK